MTCLRCDGLMVQEKFEDLDGLWSSDHEFTGWRCLNCGAIVDPVIAAHKRITSSAEEHPSVVTGTTSGLMISCGPFQPHSGGSTIS